MANKKKKKVSKKKNANKKNRNKKKKSTKKVTKSSPIKSTSSTSKKSTNKKSTTNKKNTNASNKKSSTKTSKVKDNNKIDNAKLKVTKEEKSNVEKKNKKKINKKIIQKVFIAIFTLVCIVLIVLFIKLIKDKQQNTKVEFKEVTLNEYLDLYKSEELQFIYLTNNTCMDCADYESTISKIQAEYKLSIKLFDITNLTENNLEKIKSSNSAFTNDIDIPIILAIKGGKEINYIRGVKEYSVLKKFIENSINPKETNSFEKISLDKYLTLLKNKETAFIYIGNSDNSGCKKFSPILESVSSERKMKVYYLNTDIIKTSDEWEKLENSSKIFNDVWFMPTVLVVKNGKIKDYKMETLNKTDLEKFLKKNGL